MESTSNWHPECQEVEQAFVGIAQSLTIPARGWYLKPERIDFQSSAAFIVVRGGGCARFPATVDYLGGR